MELEELIRTIKTSRSIPTEEDLRSLPNKKAFIYGRVSSQGQVRDSHESIHEVAKLVVLAKKDGYQSRIDPNQIETWLDSIQNGEDVPRTLENDDIAIDCRDLGLSGSLGEDKRPGLAALWQRVESDEAGVVYLTEGMSRLSRDRDRVLGYKLLKLLKEHKCRIRTPEGIYNPAIPRDWENLADDIEDSADEMKKLGIRLGRRRASKAAEGRHVGNPVSPGYIVKIEGQRRDGSYILGKWDPYPPHQETVVELLTEIVRQGSLHKATQTLNARRVRFSFFPQELKYMETRSALRQYLKDDIGYRITPYTLKGLATNPKLIGIWEWMDVLIENNHPAIVPKELFLQAYDVVTTKKPRGRAAYAEPMEWVGLLYCYNHGEPRQLSANNKRRQWACNYDYKIARASRCLYVNDNILTTPLTKEVLKCLDLTPHAQAVLQKLKAEVSDRNVEESRSRRQETELRARISNLERYLGSGDAKREETYWRLINEARAELEALQRRPAAPTSSPVDVERVARFLENIEGNWQTYPSRLRNRLLKLLVDRVELRHDRMNIEAKIIWKTGFEQKIRIKRPTARFTKDTVWQPEEDKLLGMLWTSSTKEILEAALPGRSYAALALRASRLKMTRHWEKKTPDLTHLWTEEDEARLKDLYTRGVNIREIARTMGRTRQAIHSRASIMGIPRPKDAYSRRLDPTWETENIKVMQESTSRRGRWSHWWWRPSV